MSYLNNRGHSEFFYVYIDTKLVQDRWKKSKKTHYHDTLLINEFLIPLLDKITTLTSDIFILFLPLPPPLWTFVSANRSVRFRTEDLDHVDERPADHPAAGAVAADVHRLDQPDRKPRFRQ